MHCLNRSVTALRQVELWSSAAQAQLTWVQLSLSIQSQFLLLRASLQARMVHLMWMVPGEAVATHIHRTDAAVWQALVKQSAT